MGVPAQSSTGEGRQSPPNLLSGVLISFSITITRCLAEWTQGRKEFLWLMLLESLVCGLFRSHALGLGIVVVQVCGGEFFFSQTLVSNTYKNGSR